MQSAVTLSFKPGGIFLDVNVLAVLGLCDRLKHLHSFFHSGGKPAAVKVQFMLFFHLSHE